MFEAPRHLFRRSSRAGARTAPTAAKADVRSQPQDRHPAMRGIDVSPVHGRHCICGRCAGQSRAA